MVTLPLWSENSNTSRPTDVRILIIWNLLWPDRLTGGSGRIGNVGITDRDRAPLGGTQLPGQPLAHSTIILRGPCRFNGRSTFNLHVGDSLCSSWPTSLKRRDKTCPRTDDSRWTAGRLDFLVKLNDTILHVKLRPPRICSVCVAFR